MALTSSTGKLNHGMKNLLLSWEQTKARWNDPVSRAFENDFIEPLQDQVRIAMRALDQLGLKVDQAIRDCSDRYM